MRKKGKRIIAFLLILSLGLVNVADLGNGNFRVKALEDNQGGQETGLGEDSSDPDSSEDSSETSESTEDPGSSEDPTPKIVYTKIVVLEAPEALVYKQSFDINTIKLEGVYLDQDETEKSESLALEKFDFSYQYVGDSEEKTDFSVLGNRMGKVTVFADYKEQDDLKRVSFEMRVIPAAPGNIVQTAASAKSITLTWEPVDGAVGYQLVMYNEKKETWSLYVKGGPTSNLIPSNSVVVKTGMDSEGTFDLEAGEDYTYKVRAFYGEESKDKNATSVYVANTVVYSDLSEAFDAVTSPTKVTDLRVKSTTSAKVKLNWTAVKGATGYIVKRRHTDKEQWVELGTVESNSFQDENLPSATTYYYRVIAYRSQIIFKSGDSASVKCSTAPVKVKLTSVKGGEGRFRVKWKKASSATGYYVYMKKSGESDYQQVADVKQGTYFYVKTGVVNGVSYDVRVEAYRNIAQINQPTVTLTFVGTVSSSKTVKPVKAKKTSTKAKLFSTKAKFKKSKAYKKVKWFRKNIVYGKSFVMAGMKNTNVAGFNNASMCPQGLTFAGSYMLMSAYDYDGEDNSVIYVMSKSTRKLLTTIVLPDDVHAGGLAYDGKYVWVSHGSNVNAVAFSQIKEAAKAKDAYKEVEYVAECAVKTSASFLTYYKGKLYVGKHVEQGTSDMYSYKVDKTKETPALVLDQSFTIPNRVQGIAFMSNGNMVLSRSNLYTKALSYYLSELDYYKPTWKGDSIKKFGKVKNKCAMPSMNEGIAINGKYIYVCYESIIFPTADQQMDRVCAFKTSALKKK